MMSRDEGELIAPDGSDANHKRSSHHLLDYLYLIGGVVSIVVGLLLLLDIAVGLLLLVVGFTGVNIYLMRRGK